MPSGVLRVVGGFLRNRRLEVLPGSRPTSERAREALFDILGPEIAGKSVLELYAGSGAVAFEALSRGAAEAAASDADVSAIESNSRRLGVVVEILRGPSELSAARLAAAGRRFDLIFADPPYRQTPRPDLAAVRRLLSPGGTLVLQTDRGETAEPPAGLKLLRSVSYGRNVFHLFRNDE